MLIPLPATGFGSREGGAAGVGAAGGGRGPCAAVRLGGAEASPGSEAAPRLRLLAAGAGVGAEAGAGPGVGAGASAGVGAGADAWAVTGSVSFADAGAVSFADAGAGSAVGESLRLLAAGTGAAGIVSGSGSDTPPRLRLLLVGAGAAGGAPSSGAGGSEAATKARVATASTASVRRATRAGLSPLVSRPRSSSAARSWSTLSFFMSAGIMKKTGSLQVPIEASQEMQWTQDVVIDESTRTWPP